MKSGKPGTAARHSQYICRSGFHGKGDNRQDLVATGSGNLPPNMASFMDMWRHADARERRNAAAYREMIGALPRELTAPQWKELVCDFIDSVIPGKPYEYAIHCPRAALEGGPQPHFHLMYTDRIPDGISRPAKQFFARFNASAPDQGGARKDSCGQDPVAFSEAARLRRERWAEIQNEHLARHGHDARVDARSYRTRGLKKEVEQHLGPATVRSLSPEGRSMFQAKRLS
ncbi:MobA/MobL family protein [Polaromonas sp.]